MSINWVMLAPGGEFTPLPNESKLWTSQPRTAFALHSLNKYPGREPLAISSSTGRIHLTNRRVIYIPDHPSPQFQSFAAPILNLHDCHVTTPFFGPNGWVAVVQPVPGGGIPSQHSAVELKLTFKDGGAYEFHDNFAQTRERVQQAIEVARATNQAPAPGGGPASAVNMDSVHLEQLPAYEEAPLGPAPGPPPGPPLPQQHPQPPAPPAPSSRPGPSSHPDEPPPGYEEVQREAVTQRPEKNLNFS